MMAQMGGMGGQEKDDQTEEEELRQAFEVRSCSFTGPGQESNI